MNKVQNHDFSLPLDPSDICKSIPIRVRVFVDKRIIQVIQLYRQNKSNKPLPEVPNAIIALMNFLKKTYEESEELGHYNFPKEAFSLDFFRGSPVRLQFLPPEAPWDHGKARSAFYLYRDENDKVTCEKVMPEDILPWDNIMPEDILPQGV